MRSANSSDRWHGETRAVASSRTPSFRGRTPHILAVPHRLHYDSTPAQIEAWFGGRSGSMRDSFEARDFRPEQDMTWRWARACRLKERDLQRLALSNLERPEDCYVRNPLHRGVCAACLDEDAEQGDHYCRRTWAYVEAVGGRSMAFPCRAPVSVVFEAVYSVFGFFRKAPGSSVLGVVLR